MRNGVPGHYQHAIELLCPLVEPTNHEFSCWRRSGISTPGKPARNGQPLVTVQAVVLNPDNQWHRCQHEFGGAGSDGTEVSPTAGQPVWRIKKVALQLFITTW